MPIAVGAVVRETVYVPSQVPCGLAAPPAARAGAVAARVRTTAIVLVGIVQRGLYGSNEHGDGVAFRLEHRLGDVAEILAVCLEGSRTCATHLETADVVAGDGAGKPPGAAADRRLDEPAQDPGNSRIRLRDVVEPELEARARREAERDRPPVRVDGVVRDHDERRRVAAGDVQGVGEAPA